MALRRFVLAPLNEVAPEAVDPLTGVTICGLLANLDRRPSFLVLIGTGSNDLFRRLVIDLPAAGLSEGAYSENHYEVLTDLLVEAPDWYAILEQKAREFDLDRWSAGLWGDRWIVSDFWFDGMFRDAESRVPDPEGWRERFLEVRARVLRPTFVVATNPYTYSQLRGWISRNLKRTPVGRDVPILWPGQDEPLSRVGSMDKETLLASFHRTLAELDTIASEIVSTCAATRAG
jgi:hypothetical protein